MTIIKSLIEFSIPNNREDYANQEENQAGYKNTVVAGSFYSRKLTLTVIRIFLMILSAHGHKELHHALHNVSNTYESALATDIQHTGDSKK